MEELVMPSSDASTLNGTWTQEVRALFASYRVPNEDEEWEWAMWLLEQEAVELLTAIVRAAFDAGRRFDSSSHAIAHAREQ